jgi:hypothetical protein
MPETTQHLYESTMPVFATGISGGPYSWPLPGLKEGAADFRQRLNAYLATTKDVISWCPFNKSQFNEGAMTSSADPAHALAERATNMWDAIIEMLRRLHPNEPAPKSPREAMERWGELDSKSREELRQFVSERYMVVRHYGHAAKTGDSFNNVIDFRDYGTGMALDKMGILTLHAGNKVYQPWQVGKHGQGAAASYQSSGMTLIVTREQGSDEVGFTIVDMFFPEGASTPSFHYLLVDGKIPVVKDPDFRPGTLVRHVGYKVHMPNPFGNNSLCGTLCRLLPEAIIPIEVDHYALFDRIEQNKGVGHLDGRFTQGSAVEAEVAWKGTFNQEPGHLPREPGHILHRGEELYHLGKYDCGGGIGIQELGSVKFRYWVRDWRGKQDQADEAKGKKKDSRGSDNMKGWMRPDCPIQVVLDGQTHSEELRRYITDPFAGANIWGEVGKNMLVNINCDGLTRYGRFYLFASTRESLKDTFVKKMILGELVRRIKQDARLNQLHKDNVAPKRSEVEGAANWAELFEKYCKNNSLDFDKITRYRTVTETEEVETDVEHKVTRRGEREVMVPEDPPTRLEWALMRPVVRLYPGQKYGWYFKTNAPKMYWDPESPHLSRIHVMTTPPILNLGYSPWEGGYVKCHFQCAENAKIGSEGLISVRLQPNTPGAAVLTADLRVLIVENQHQDPGTEEKEKHGDVVQGKTKTTKTTTKRVEVRVPILQPQPIKSDDPQWGNLGWGAPAKHGFAIRQVDGVQLYYNAEYPKLLEAKKALTRRGLGDKFIETFEMRLMIHAATELTLGCSVGMDQMVDEKDAADMIRKLLCVCTEDAIHSAVSEVEMEMKLEREGT